MNYLMAHKKAGVKTHCKHCIIFFVLPLRLHAQVSRVSISFVHVFMCIKMGIHLIAQGSSPYGTLLMAVILFWLIS